MTKEEEFDIMLSWSIRLQLKFPEISIAYFDKKDGSCPAELYFKIGD